MTMKIYLKKDYEIWANVRKYLKRIIIESKKNIIYYKLLTQAFLQYLDVSLRSSRKYLLVVRNVGADNYYHRQLLVMIS